jgi:hypothetical protein
MARFWTGALAMVSSTSEKSIMIYGSLWLMNSVA